MHKLALSMLLLLVTLPAFAEQQVLICEDCREVHLYPEDFGNYAYNQLISPIPNSQFSWYTTYSTSAYVWNPSGDYALVRMDDVLQELQLSLNFGFFSMPVMVSSDFVRIRVQSMHGATIEYELLETSQPLTVGGELPPPPPPPPSSTTETETDSGGGAETVCCQDGAYYWYYDLPEFEIQVGNG